MRVFLSHCINDSLARQAGFRDTADDLTRLRELGNRLEADGFRVFEYLQFTRESRSGDVLDKLARQITLADVFVLVTTRREYTAPGWMVPELFYARALGKPVVCCALYEAPVEAFGDPAARNRFLELLREQVSCPGVEATLQRLRDMREKADCDGASDDPFYFAGRLAAWAAGGLWRSKGAIESFFAEYHQAWMQGFRPARHFLRAIPFRAPPGGLCGVSSWLDDERVLLQYRQSTDSRQLVLLETARRLIQTAHLLGPKEILTAGHAATGAVVVVSRTGENKVELGRFASDAGDWETFSAELAAPAAVTSGVIRDRWFSGSVLFRIRWDKRRLDKTRPEPADWEAFRRFSWKDCPCSAPQTSGLECVLLGGNPERWTLLPRHFVYLRGDARANARLLLAWHGDRFWCGDVEAAAAFGTGLPSVEELDDDGRESPAAGPPPFLLSLCGEGRLPKPRWSLERTEDERELRIFWRGVNRRSLRAKFKFQMELGQAQAFASSLASPE